MSAGTPDTDPLARDAPASRIATAVRAGTVPAVAVVLAAAAAAEGLGATATITVEGAAVGRNAACLINNAESSALRLARLRTRAADFDADTCDRFLTGTMLPAAWLVRAQAARRWWANRLAAVFADWDLLLAPATPGPAPRIGQRTMMLAGREMLVRPNLGLYTQPVPCVGLPVVAVPVGGGDVAALPVGVQIIAAPWREALCLRAARVLEAAGIAVPARPHPEVLVAVAG